ncbi:MAG TPA: methyltransferase domain-containing protein [Capsulimonadaceae bacterium]
MSEIDFTVRSTSPEWMDDFSITDDRLIKALDELRLVNRLLGGYSSTLSVLIPALRAANGPVRILDVGAGVGDLAEVIALWAVSQPSPVDVQIVATDANPATVEYARQSLARRLPTNAAALVNAEVADATNLPYGDNEFDVVMASMFLHHFDDITAATVLASMNRVARRGIIVSDLQRHPVAYHGFRALATLTGACDMVRHDGPISVLRGFTRQELTHIAHRAGIATTGPQWRWAFRWLLSTVPNAL